MGGVGVRCMTMKPEGTANGYGGAKRGGVGCDGHVKGVREGGGGGGAKWEPARGALEGGDAAPPPPPPLSRVASLWPRHCLPHLRSGGADVHTGAKAQVCKDKYTWPKDEWSVWTMPRPLLSDTGVGG